MADRRPVETLVERDDGVVLAMRGAGGGAELPHDLVHALVAWPLHVTDTRGYNYAEVTEGGVALTDIDPSPV